MTEHTRLRPHWRPTHNADPAGFDRWIRPDGANGWVKILNPDGHLCRRVWEVAPDAWLVLRHHPWSEQKAEMLRAPVDLGRAHATQWHGWLMQHGLLDAARNGRVALEGINEPAIWQPGVSEAVVAYEIARMEHTERLGLTAACCVMQVNTGWPGNHGPDTPPDWTPFERLRVALLRMGGYLGAHEYWDARGPDSDDWTWNPGRILQQGEEWDGIPVLITECGYDQAVNAPEGTPHHGWSGHQSVDVTMAQLTEYDRRLRTEPRLRKRVKAAFVFTHDFDPPWGTFDTRPLTDRLCLHAEWTRGQAAPSEPSQTHTVNLPVIAGNGLKYPDPEPTGLPPVTQPQPPRTLDPRVMEAVLLVESRRRAFGSDGRLIIRLEAHILKRYVPGAWWEQHFAHGTPAHTGQMWRPSPDVEWRTLHTGGQPDEWAAFQFAHHLFPEAACLSISMGASQVMGFNHARIGFASAQDMFDVMSGSESSHYVAMCNYMLSDPALHAAVNARDWPTIGKLYNGAASAGDKYKAAYAALWGEP